MHICLYEKNLEQLEELNLVTSLPDFLNCIPTFPLFFNRCISTFPLLVAFIIIFFTHSFGGKIYLYMFDKMSQQRQNI